MKLQIFFIVFLFSVLNCVQKEHYDYELGGEYLRWKIERPTVRTADRIWVSEACKIIGLVMGIFNEEQQFSKELLIIKIMGLYQCENIYHFHN